MFLASVTRKNRFVLGASFGAIATVLAFACGDSDGGTAPISPFPSGEGGFTTDAPFGIPDGTPIAPGQIRGQIYGRQFRVPIANRAVRLRDSKGKTVDVTTDAAGNFSAVDMAPPYDVFIAPSGAGAKSAAYVYLGVTPQVIKVFGDVEETPPALHSATVTINWSTPSCTGGNCRMEGFVHTQEGTIERFGRQALSPGTGPLHAAQDMPPINAPVKWYSSATSMAVDVGFLLLAPDNGSFYLATANVTVNEGQTVPVELTVNPVPALGVATVSATSSATTFQPASVATLLQLPGATGAFQIRNEPAPYTLGLPNIPGATLTFSGRQFGSPPPFNVVGGEKVGIAPAAGAQTVELGDPNPVQAPAPNGTASISVGSIDFRPVNDARFRILTWVPNAKPGYVITLAAPKLEFTRLNGLTAPPAIAPGGGELIVEEHVRSMDAYVTDVTALATTRFATTSYPITLSP